MMTYPAVPPTTTAASSATAISGFCVQADRRGFEVTGASTGRSRGLPL